MSFNFKTPAMLQIRTGMYGGGGGCYRGSNTQFGFFFFSLFFLAGLSERWVNYHVRRYPYPMYGNMTLFLGGGGVGSSPPPLGIILYTPLHKDIWNNHTHGTHVHVCSLSHAWSSLCTTLDCITLCTFITQVGMFVLCLCGPWIVALAKSGHSWIETIAFKVEQ